MSGSEPQPRAPGEAGGPLAARWFDGRQARGLDVTLSMAGDELHLAAPDGQPRHYPRRGVVWPERTRHGVRQVLLPDGGVVEVHDPTAWDRWAAVHGLHEPAAVRWALSWRAAVVAVLAMLVLLVSGVRWGVPWAAEQVAPLVPMSLRQHLDALVMQQLQRRSWVQPHTLGHDVERRLESELQRMVEAAYPAGQRPAVRVAVHRLPDLMGPNAFALPGGQIVVSQALLELLPSRGEQLHPGVLGVLAHEVGHVHQLHGLRHLLASSATAALMGWWIGDYSAVLAGAPAFLMEAAYSRESEREADDEALRIMRLAGVDPRGMVDFFQALQRQNGGAAGEGPSFGLATHPPDAERIRLFETGQR